MTRVVLDPNVIVSALIAPGGTSRRAVDATLMDGTDLVVSPQWLREISEVSARPRFRRWFGVETAETLIGELWRAAIQLEDPTRPASLGPDPDDDYLLALAEAAGAILVTGDQALVEHQGPATALSPAAFVARQTPQSL